MTRMEELLTALLNGESVQLEPQSRIEQYLKNCCDKCGCKDLPAPTTRAELLLYQLAEQLANGGGGGSTSPIEGTAIPVGEAVERIYFNTNLSVEETNAYLSQLTYVLTPLYPCPICVIYGNTADGNTGTFVLVAEVDRGVSYTIRAITNISDGTSSLFYDNEWEYVAFDTVHALVNGFICDNAGVALTDFNGLPIGAENEKIKNVLSITPFVSGGTGGGASAYTVTSVDELPSNAVDGSMAIVPSDSIVGEWEFHEALTIDIYSEISAVYGENYVNEFALTINDELQELELRCMCAGSGTYIYPYDNGVWLEGVSRRFRFLKDTDDENFKNFLKFDARRLSGGYSLYTRENGEWVYKCEVV